MVIEKRSSKFVNLVYIGSIVYGNLEFINNLVICIKKKIYNYKNDLWFIKICDIDS